MAGQQFTLQNTDTSAVTGTVAFRVYVPWSRGQYSSIATLRSNEKVQINGVQIDTFWESFGAPHWDGTIHHTYAVFRYNLAAGTASPTAPAVTGEIVRVASATPVPNFPAWADDIDIVIAYDEDDPVDPNSYSLSLGDVARAGGNGSSYSVETSGGSRYVFFSAWTGNGSHSSPAARRVSSDPAHATYTGNLHVYAWLEIRSDDTHGLLEVFFANDAAYPAGTNTATPVGPVTAPDGVAYPNAPASATCASTLDQDMRRWIDAMTITISSPSATLYSAPIGVNDYSTGVGPTGTIAPSGSSWTLPIEGLGWGGGWTRSWIVATGADAVPAQTKATHFGTLYGYPKVQTAQAHRRQKNLLGNSMNMAGYRWPVAAGMTEAIANEGFASGPAAKASWYATNRTNPFWFPNGHGFGTASGTYFVLGECPSPFGQFVYAGSPWHAHVAYLRTVQDAAVVPYHKETEALESLSTLWDSTATSELGYTAFWDGEDNFWTSEVQFGLRRASGQNILANYNGSTVQTQNPDAQWAAGEGGRPDPRNAEHYGTLHLFWTSLILGSRMCQHFLREKGILAARQIHSVHYGNSRPTLFRAEARVLDGITDSREIAYQDSTVRDELILISSRRAAAHSQTATPGGWKLNIFGIADDGNTPNARRFGLSTGTIESIAGRQYFPWQASYYALSLMRIAFAQPESTSQTDYSDTIAENARIISQICTEKLVSLDTSRAYNGTVLSAPARREMDGWFAARAAEFLPQFVQDGILVPKSRGVDLARSSGTTVEFGDYVIDLGPSNAGQTLQAGAVFVVCLAFPTNSSVAGLIERAQAIFDRVSTLYPQFANGREYYGSLGVACGLFVGAGPSDPGTGVIVIPPAAVEGEDPPIASDFGTLPTAGPSLSLSGGYAAFINQWAPPTAGASLSVGGFVSSFLGSTPPDPSDPTITVELAVPLDEPEDVRCFILAEDGDVGEAVLTGPGMVPVFHGMRRGTGSVSMEVSGRRLYVANGIVRPVEYGENGASYAGITPPAGELDLSVERKSIGIRSQGALLITGDMAGSAISNITGYRFSSDDVGKILYVPSARANGGGGTQDGPDVLGVVSAVTAFDTISYASGDNPTFAAASIWLFPKKTTDTVIDATSWESALELLPQSTPYSDERPQADGTPAAGTTNDLCMDFRGRQAVVCFGVDAELDRDVVIDLKGYFRPESIGTQGGGRVILWTRYTPDQKAAFELSIIDNGRVEFRFWDTNLADWRSIATVGRCFTENAWHYLRFRYEFKNAGGWQVDDRNILRSTTGLPVSRGHRDGLWVWNLEGKNPADRFLVVAGCHNAFDIASPAAYNSSREIGNTGYLQDDPWIGPRSGDQGFDNGSLATERTVMIRATKTATSWRWQMRSATAMYLARWMSQNRDEPYEIVAGAQINDAQGNYHTQTISGSPGTAITGNYGRSILVYVYGPNSGTEFGTPRILALQSIGDSDLDSNEATGKVNTTFVLSNSVAFGADGLAEGVGTGSVSGAGDYIIAFAIPNGSNHAAAATGNTVPIPTLMIQGENPVGTNDAPMKLGGTIYVGGIDQNENLTNPDGRALIRDSERLNFKGQLDDVGFSIKAKSTATTPYTADHMPPDIAFNGPVDTRLGSLPQLNFTAATTGYDVNGPNNTTGAPTWASRFDTLRGRQLSSITGSAPQVNGEVRGLSNAANELRGAHGKHKATVTFYDPVRDHESPPSEIGEVTVQVQPDELEPDAERVVLFDRLPICAEQGREIWRRVYMTLPDGDTFFMAAEVRDNLTTQVRVAVDTIRFVNEARADFGYRVPPVCRFLAASESRMFFGGILDAESAIYWSEPFRPWEVPGRAEVLEANDGGYVNGIRVLNGTPLAFSRSAIFAGQDVGENLFQWARVQANTGALSHTAIIEMEDALFFPDGKGVFAFDGTSRVSYLSDIVRPTYRALDSISMRRAFGAYSRHRSQYLLTGSEGRSPYQETLLTLQLKPDTAPVWSREYHPQGISALIGGSDPQTDDRRVYAGTPSGFVMELDAGARTRGQYEGELYGVVTASVLGGGGSYFVLLDMPDFDDALDGVAGVPFLITREAGGHTAVVDQGFIWRFDGTRAHTMQKVAADVRYGDQFWLGGWAMQWASKAYDFRVGTMRKQLQSVDLICDQEADGVIELTTHADFAEAATATRTCPMAKGFDLPHVSTRGAFVQVKLLKVCQRPTRIHNLALRVQVQTQRGGGDGSST